MPPHSSALYHGNVKVLFVSAPDPFSGRLCARFPLPGLTPFSRYFVYPWCPFPGARAAFAHGALCLPTVSPSFVRNSSTNLSDILLNPPTSRPRPYSRPHDAVFNLFVAADYAARLHELAIFVSCSRLVQFLQIRQNGSPRRPAPQRRPRRRESALPCAPPYFRP